VDIVNDPMESPLHDDVHVMGLAWVLDKGLSNTTCMFEYVYPCVTTLVLMPFEADVMRMPPQIVMPSLFMRPPEVYANPVNENERLPTLVPTFCQVKVTLVPVICVMTHADP